MKRIISAILAAMCIISCFVFTSNSAFAGEDKIVLVLDPGHGDENPGACNGGAVERDINLKIARLIKQKLDANGSFTVYLTRDGGRDLSLCERGIRANGYNADALISIHCDGSTVKSESGVTVYASVLPRFALVSLSSKIASSVASAVGFANNGVKQRADNEGYYWDWEKQWDIKGVNTGTLSDYYGIPTWCAKFGIPAIIVEHGYISNAHDVAILKSDANLEKIAAAEAQAIISYYTNHTHNYGAPITDYPSNCMFQGKKSSHCTVCGHRKGIELLAPNGSNHYWLDTQTKPASCGVDGSITRVCRITVNMNEKKYPVTNHVETTVIPAPTQHEFKLVEKVEATHTVDGYMRYQCVHCTNSFKEPLKAEGHTWEKGAYIEPTCDKQGGTPYICKVCKEEKLDAVPALGHKWGEEKKTEPTCTEKGHYEKECTVCKYVHIEEPAALGHDSSALEKKEATCTEAGYLKGKCPRCNEETNEVTDPIGHAYEVSKTVDPACAKDGKVVSVCKNCEVEKSEKVIATGHDWKSGEENTAPGLFSKGMETLKCNNCDKEKLHYTDSYFMENIKFIAIGAGALLLLIIAAFLVLVRVRRKRAHQTAGTDPFVPFEPWKEDAEKAEEAKEKEPAEID